jgi:hypothetical protein
MDGRVEWLRLLTLELGLIHAVKNVFIPHAHHIGGVYRCMACRP